MHIDDITVIVKCVLHGTPAALDLEHHGQYSLVLAPVIESVKLKRVLIDGESALNILFAKTVNDMKIPRLELPPGNAPFHGVIPGLSATPLGHITLPVTFGTKDNYWTENIFFKVADFETTYHAIIGRPALAKFTGIPHYTYLMVKMSGPHGVITLRSDIKQAFSCEAESCEIAQQIEEKDGREKIHEESTRVSRKVIEHSLNVRDDAKPIKQRLRLFAHDRKDVIKEELTKLLAAGFIKEVKYPDCLDNPVLIKKNNKW
ncbi:uncharacterized protein LOC121054716 [Oryza brachyantha]|uniref:uncharacterized protein LOC121054716 n=1 Tax=Oryza brachyantha TaxID=4533 RepID=UPI001ADCA34B|nr:uncharacterized protein LOC121054716 [Oryza brachyantha]